MAQRYNLGVLLGLASALTLGHSGSAQTWTSLGPAPITRVVEPTNPGNLNSGRIASIAVDPNDLNHWLVGVGNGGVWESLNAGTTFRPIADDAPTLAIGAVAFAPSDPKIIYAATGEATATGFAHGGLGMLKSTDGGKTWALLGASSLGRAAVRRVQVHPTDPNTVLVTLSRGGFGKDTQEVAVGAPQFGVLRSSNGGAAWVQELAGQATALEVDAANFNNQYAGIGDVRVEHGLGDTPGGVNGIYRSTDSGQTWSIIAGPWGTSTAAKSSVGRIELAIAPSNRNVLYAGIGAPPGEGASSQPLLGLYRTDDAWAAKPTWIKIPTGPTGVGGYCGPGKCNYSHVLSVNPTDPDILIAGGGESGQGVWLCSDCGSSPTWTNPAFRKGVHSDNHAMAWAGNRLITGNDGGVWSTADLGETWQDHNLTLPTGMFYSGALHPTNPNFMLGGLRDFQLGVRTATNTWVVLDRVSPDREWGEAEVALSSSRPDTDWMAAWCCTGIISRTTDGGKSGVAADAGIDRTAAPFVAPVEKCPTNDDIFLTGTNRLWRTDNFFNSAAPAWFPNSPQLTAPAGVKRPFPLNLGNIMAIAFSPADGTCKTYAYGNMAGQVRLTRDGGGTWTDLDINKNLPERTVNFLAFDPGNPNVLYAALSSFDEATPGKPGHVFKSINAMAASPSWVNVSPPLNQPFNVIAVDPVNPKLVYAGSDTGLWRSTNAAAAWSRMGLQNGVPPSVTVHDIQINPATNRTVVFTYGRGAYALDTGAPAISQVTNAASYVPWITPGSLATVFGENLSSVVGVEFPGAATIHRGVSVTVQGIPAPLLAVANVNGQEQINFQVPFNISVPSTRVEVNNNGAVAFADPVPVLSLQPGFFEYVPGGANLSYAAVIRPNASTVSPSNPAVRGETVLLYLTGLGGTSPAVTTGQFGPSNPPAVTTQLPNVSIGGVPAQVSFSGYAPGFLGLYQMNVAIPTNAPVGSAVELKVVMTSLPGELPSPVSSQTSHIAVQ